MRNHKQRSGEFQKGIFEDFLGSDVEEFSLVLINKDEMRYRGDQQGLVGDRDVFSREP